MIIIPAIDLKDGQCVRLRQGRFDDLTVFGEDPVAMAAHWVEQGATRLHLVDLDGAIEGKPVHGAVIKQICQNYPDLDVQIGGGIRSEKSIDEYLQAGVKQVIIGTRAVNEPEWIESIAQHYPQQLIIGLDAKNGLLAVDGWKNVATLKAVDLAIRFSALPVYGFVYTDISRDGMLTGVNIETTLEMAQAVKQPVIASGGIANIDDIKALLALGEIYGAITGRAIYEGHLDFTQAQKLSQATAS